MMLKTTAVVVALLAGVALVGCQDKPDTMHTGPQDRMNETENNNPVNGPPGAPAVGSSGDAPGAAVGNDVFGRGNNSTDANGHTPAAGPMAPYNGATPPTQPGGSLNRTGTSTDSGGTSSGGSGR